MVPREINFTVITRTRDRQISEKRWPLPQIVNSFQPLRGGTYTKIVVIVVQGWQLPSMSAWWRAAMRARRTA